MSEPLGKTELLKVAAFGLWGGAVASAVIGLVVSLRFQSVPGLDKRLILIGGVAAFVYAVAGCLLYPGLVFKNKEGQPG